jgi:hypothetical protein
MQNTVVAGWQAQNASKTCKRKMSTVTGTVQYQQGRPIDSGHTRGHYLVWIDNYRAGRIHTCLLVLVLGIWANMHQNVPKCRSCRLCLKTPSSARERAFFRLTKLVPSDAEGTEASDIGCIVDGAGCGQADNRGCLYPKVAVLAA